MNKLYEGMFVFDANHAGKDWPGLEQHVNDLVQRHEGQMVHSERWPDRKLAYEMKGCKKGTYYLTYFNAPTTAIQGLQRDCELSDRVLRAMFLYEDELAADCKKLKAREEAKAVEAEAAAAAKAEGVTIEASYTVGEYDILILSAEQSNGLARWLKKDSGNWWAGP